jgi:endonuclease-3 related protein
MPSFDDAFGEVSWALESAFGRGPSGFEGLEPFEAMIAVLLARTLGESRWRTALDGLAEAGLLTPKRLADVGIIELRDAVSDKGRSLSTKTLLPLKHLAGWLVEHHGGQVDSLFNPDRSTGWIRGELAAIKGVGMPGADAILLHALKRPSYPIDRATYRILVRHGWLDPTASYDEARDLLVDQAVDPAGKNRAGALAALDDDRDAVRLLANLAHGMEQVGQRYCRATTTDCEQCPLERFLPEGGPRGAED